MMITLPSSALAMPPPASPTGLGMLVRKCQLILLAPALTWLTIMIGAQFAHIAVDQSRLFAASFNMFPVALITLGLVYALVGRLRHVGVQGCLYAYLILAFLEELLEGMVPMPSAMTGW